MPENSWPENDSYSEFEPLDSLLSDVNDLKIDLLKGGSGRRIKAALVLMLIWSSTISLHLIAWGHLLVWFLTSILWLQAFRVLFAHTPSKQDRVLGMPGNGQNISPSPFPIPHSPLPLVSLLVAAKNEESVIANLLKTLCHQDYPLELYEVWVVDDHSTDGTPAVLEALSREYSHLKVLRRAAGATGGKSGALNQVLPLTKGDIIAVFDADAAVTPDMLSRTLPLFNSTRVGAVQLRKAIANAQTNFWTRGQMAEMALDSYFQEQRISITGIGELRGNGQFVRRQALQRCGGWNEETITDDLDLTLRLHLDDWDVQFVAFPPVQEEGVTNFTSLWHQRSRWAEGGYQRYLDYWRLIFRNRMGFLKTIDLLGFCIIQYILPTAAVPDLLMAIARHRLMVLSPLTTMALTLSLVGMFTGLRRMEKRPFFVTCLQTIRGVIYMFHWFVVMAVTTARMSVLPKRLKWVKTVHKGMDN